MIGEVYRLHDPRAALIELDRYEEFGPDFPEPAEYVRRELPVTMAGGDCLTAWVYLYNRPVSEDARILCGDFLA